MTTFKDTSKHHCSDCGAAIGEYDWEHHARFHNGKCADCRYIARGVSTYMGTDPISFEQGHPRTIRIANHTVGR